MFRPKSSKNAANTIVEAIVVIVIISFGIIGTFQLVGSGTKLAATTENRILAINLAREGIEAVENIRNTNWLKFSSNLENCFDVKGYDNACVGGGSVATLYGGPYHLSNESGLWYVRGDATSWSGVAFDGNGLSIQGTGSSLPRCQRGSRHDCRSIFSRTIRITDVGVAGAKALKVRSSVSWRDASRTEPYEVTLEKILTNWKESF